MAFAISRLCLMISSRETHRAFIQKMTSLISYKNDQGFHRVVLDQDEFVGVYVLVFDTEAGTIPARDYLQDDVEMAKLFCHEDLGVPRESWKPIERPPL